MVIVLTKMDHENDMFKRTLNHYWNCAHNATVLICFQKATSVALEKFIDQRKNLLTNVKIYI